MDSNINQSLKNQNISFFREEKDVNKINQNFQNLKEKNQKKSTSPIKSTENEHAKKLKEFIENYDETSLQNLVIKENIK